MHGLGLGGPSRRQAGDRCAQDGRSNKEIQRCLKRYLVREFYPLIITDLRALNRAA